VVLAGYTRLDGRRSKWPQRTFIAGSLTVEAYKKEPLQKVVEREKEKRKNTVVAVLEYVAYLCENPEALGTDVDRTLKDFLVRWV
jgi:hypothetical protein